VVVTGLILLVLLVVGFSMGRASSQAAGPVAHRAPATVTVAPAETLWQVARRVAPHVDPRIVVARIEALNHLGGAQVEAGQQLVVPRTQ
jgi:formate-dependent phosphoribosylglycinamide formyltransferase (GAR transformylase)